MISAKGVEFWRGDSTPITLNTVAMSVDWWDIGKFILDVLLASAAAIAAVWRLSKGYVDSQVKREKEFRTLADSRIEDKLVDNNEKVHINMGKLELIDMRLQESERKRMQEMYEIRTALQDGLHRIEIQIERVRQHQTRRENKGE